MFQGDTHSYYLHYMGIHGFCLFPRFSPHVNAVPTNQNCAGIRIFMHCLLEGALKFRFPARVFYYRNHNFFIVVVVTSKPWVVYTLSRTWEKLLVKTQSLNNRPEDQRYEEYLYHFLIRHTKFFVNQECHENCMLRMCMDNCTRPSF